MLHNKKTNYLNRNSGSSMHKFVPLKSLWKVTQH